MKEFKIAGLSTKQVELLDIMWNLESSNELTEWMDTLSVQEIKQVLVLKEILLAHCLDEINETQLANDYLKRFRL